MAHSETLLQRMRVHEAGHALVASARIPRPSEFHIVIGDPAVPQSTFVRCRTVPVPVERMRDNLLVHSMLMYLGGYGAEQLVFGGDAELAADDLLRWQERAVVFIRRHGKAGWTEENAFENHLLLLKLFFIKNEQLLRSLAQEEGVGGVIDVNRFLSDQPGIYYPERYFPRPSPADFQPMAA